MRAEKDHDDPKELVGRHEAQFDYLREDLPMVDRCGPDRGPFIEGCYTDLSRARHRHRHR
ncbi:hypothetical protein [Tardiphaga sp. P9-11]|uniref:hypothetical protein n=1 Tax=Tardiphaga sp. P9-11 TaxID=2024614 RepID=UPI0011F33A30|nr:hypothetical protein [Tardiphaga sp. P9-11]KAA0069936.1 hypothetical protein CIW50_28295 [Tardiphaga sp. P9-11]